MFNLIFIGFPAAIVAGFLIFMDHISQIRPGNVPPAQAVVVFTGGPERVNEGVRLLLAGAAPQLLISGVGQDETLAGLSSKLAVRPDLVACCVTLDRLAINTRGNAQSTQAWVQAKGIRTIILVTNNLHMPRALVEANARLPGVKIMPHPIAGPLLAPWPPVSVHLGRKTRLELMEYLKFLAATARLAIGIG